MSEDMLEKSMRQTKALEKSMRQTIEETLEKMSDHPLGFNFAAALEGKNDHPLEYTDNRLVGANPDQVDGYWDTKEEAIVNFATQLSQMAHAARHHFLFVRRAPELEAANQFEGGTKWRMIGRFSIAKLKDEK